MSTLTLTRDDFSKLVKIDTTGMSHTRKLDAFAKAIGYENQTALMGGLKSREKPEKPAGDLGSEAILAAAKVLLKMRKSILADVSSAHSARGPAASGWMRETIGISLTISRMLSRIWKPRSIAKPPMSGLLLGNLRECDFS